MTLLDRVFGSLRIVGTSRATAETVFCLPSFRLALDLGLCPPELIGASVVVLSHTHLDHINGLPVLAAHRDLRRMPPPRVVTHAEEIPLLQDLLAAYHRLDRARSLYGCEFVPIAPGERVPVDATRSVLATPAFHVTPSMGYVLLEQRSRLKPAFRGWPRERIRDAARAGETVSEAYEHPLLYYLGDTDAQALDVNRQWLCADVVLAECTFLREDERELAQGKKHMHLDDFIERADWFRCRQLVLTHFSLRYTAAQIHRKIQTAQTAFAVPLTAFVQD